MSPLSSVACPALRRRSRGLTATLIAILAATTVAVAADNAETPDGNSLVGAWRIQAFSFVGAGGNEIIPQRRMAELHYLLGDAKISRSCVLLA